MLRNSLTIMLASAALVLHQGTAANAEQNHSMAGKEHAPAKHDIPAPATPAMSKAATKIGPLTITGAWARARLGTAPNSAAYLKIHNSGAGGDRLTAVAAGIARKVQTHTNINDAGIMRMRHVEGFDIPANGTAELKPGGDHIMIMGLHAPLEAGSSFPLTLTFAKAGTVEITVKVLGLGQTPPAHKH